MRTEIFSKYLVDPFVHSGSHRKLLSAPEPPEVNGRKLDAIIVPSARPAGHLRHAFRLATAHGCTLVVLCSHRSRADAVIAESTARGHRIDIVAVDLPDRQPSLLPRLATSDLVAGTIFHREADTSLKRNLGLVIARMCGWRSVVFLDDDIKVRDQLDLRRVAGLLGQYDMVGLDIGGYPDNSVVCHANRETGGDQDTFVGGGALAFAADRVDSFFPRIYNEDWFFLLGEHGLRDVAVAGRATQRRYDPFADPDRARAEEFGDTLAEGVLALLDRGRRLRNADKEFWRTYLRTRRTLIEDVQARVDESTMDARTRSRITASLAAARERLRLINPELCVEYLKCWLADGHAWRTMLAGLPGSRDIEVALKTLGLSEEARISRGWDGSSDDVAPARARTLLTEIASSGTRLVTALGWPGR
jgi:hypothetical protein